MQYKKSNKKFVNPYNFVNLPNKANERGRAEVGELTGKLHCVIFTKTPLAILDTESVKFDKDHPIYSFYKVDGKRCIPGSSIRGMLRSAYETVTDSCFVTMPENDYLSARVSHRMSYSPGLLIRENDKWKLYSAKRLYVRTQNGKDQTKNQYKEIIQNGVRCITDGKEMFHLGDEVKLLETATLDGRVKRTIVNKMVHGHSEGTAHYVYVGEPIRNKIYQSVFKKVDALKYDSKLIDSALDKLEYTVSIYQNKSINRNYDGSGKVSSHYGYADFEKTKKRGVIPLWYSEADGNLYFSMAAIGRKVYEHTVNDFVGWERIPCSSRERMCPACNLFGMANGDARGSLIRISDAQETYCGRAESACLKELGTPRTSYYKFYSQNGLEYDSDGAMISGRKFYWHNPAAATNKEIYSTKEKNNRNATVELVTDSKFEFDVYFDRVSKEQLEELKWVITLGENSQKSKLCHKLGHGKPLGLGSVKMVITEEQIRHFDIEDGYNIVENNNVNISGKGASFVDYSVKQFITINDFSLMDGKDVRYPYVDVPNGIKDKFNDNAVAAHNWFRENREPLRSIRSDNHEFYAISISDDNKPTYNGSKAKNTGGYQGKAGSKWNNKGKGHKE